MKLALQNNKHWHFLTPDPIVPFCKINDFWSNLPRYGAENVFKKGSYCTFFRPMLADYGICYTMNSFEKVKIQNQTI